MLNEVFSDNVMSLPPTSSRIEKERMSKSVVKSKMVVFFNKKGKVITEWVDGC
jgi:hypothetical protein